MLQVALHCDVRFITGLKCSLPVQEGAVVRGVVQRPAAHGLQRGGAGGRQRGRQRAHGAQEGVQRRARAARHASARTQRARRRRRHAAPRRLRAAALRTINVKSGCRYSALRKRHSVEGRCAKTALDSQCIVDGCLFVITQETPLSGPSYIVLQPT